MARRTEGDGGVVIFASGRGEPVPLNMVMCTRRDSNPHIPGPRPGPFADRSSGPHFCVCVEVRRALEDLTSLLALRVGGFPQWPFLLRYWCLV